MISGRFQGKPFNITVIQVYAPSPDTEEAKIEQFSEDLQHILELTPKKSVLFIIEDWHAKVGNQEIPGVTGRFGLRVQNEAGQKLSGFVKRPLWSQQIPSSNNTREDSTHGHQQMVNTKSRVSIFFADKDGEARYSQKKKKKKKQEMTGAQIMSSLLQTLDLN